MKPRVGPRLAPIAIIGTLLIACSSPPAPQASEGSERSPSSVGVPGATPSSPTSVTVRLPGGVPPVRLDFGPSSFVVTGAGVHQVAQPSRRIPHGAFWVTADGTWVRIRSKHVEFGRGGRVLWRSSRTYPYRDGASLSAYAISPSGIAYQVRRAEPFYVAAGRGTEHPLAIRAWDLSWTRAGNLFVMQRGSGGSFSYALLGTNGTLVRTLAENVTTREDDNLDEANGLVTYVADGTVWWTDGAQVASVTRLVTLGYDERAQVYPIGGGLIEVLQPGKDWNVTILRRDGTIYSHPTPPNRHVSGFGAWTADATGTWAAALSVDEATKVGTVWLLTAGVSHGSPIVRIPGANPCELPLSWQGRWLLIASHTGRSVAVLAYNTATHRLVRLPSTIDGKHPSGATWA